MAGADEPGTMKLSPFALLLLAASCGNDAAQQDQAAASMEVAMETIFGGEENLALARARANAEQARQETPKPVWDPITYDEVRELWTRSVQKTLLAVSMELDGTTLDEGRRKLSTLIDENHADFEDALRAWPSLRDAALRWLDAQEEKAASEAAEAAATNARLAEKGAMYENFVRSPEALAAEALAEQDEIEKQRGDVEAIDRLIGRSRTGGS